MAAKCFERTIDSKSISNVVCIASKDNFAHFVDSPWTPLGPHPQTQILANSHFKRLSGTYARDNVAADSGVRPSVSVCSLPGDERQVSWRLGVVVSVIRRINEVTVHWAWLVLGWVTVFGRVYHHGV